MNFFVSVRNGDGKFIELSHIVYSYDNLSLGYMSASYSLMAKMMKCKSNFQLSKEQQQVGFLDGKFIFIRSFPSSLFEIEDFCAVAEKNERRFLWARNY